MWRGVALGLACVGLAACQQSPQNGAAGVFHPRVPGVLTVATDQVPTPGMYEGTAAHLTGGFEFELARALARRFGLARVRVITIPFARLVTGDLGGADLALALLTPTNARERVLDFSDAYFDVPPVVLARNEISVPDLKTARRLRWVTQIHSTLAEILDAQIQPTSPARRTLAQSEEIALLETDRVDAALLDFPQAVALATRSPRTLRVAAKLGQPEQIAAAMPKGSGNDQAVDSAIRALIANGTINALAKRWLGPAASSNGQDIPVLESTR